MYKDRVSDLEILQTQHHHRSVFSGVGILKIKQLEGTERKAKYRREELERQITGGRIFNSLASERALGQHTALNSCIGYFCSPYKTTGRSMF